MIADTLDILILGRRGLRVCRPDTRTFLRRAGADLKLLKRGSARGAGRHAVTTRGPVEIAIGPPVADLLLRLLRNDVDVGGLNGLAVSQQAASRTAAHRVIRNGAPGNALSVAGRDGWADFSAPRSPEEIVARDTLARACAASPGLIDAAFASFGDRVPRALIRRQDGTTCLAEEAPGDLWIPVHPVALDPIAPAFDPGPHCLPLYDLVWEYHLHMIRLLSRTTPFGPSWQVLEDGEEGRLYAVNLPA